MFIINVESVMKLINRYVQMINFGVYDCRKNWQENVTLTDVFVDVTVRTELP